MNKRKIFFAYVYTCDKHSIGEFVRDIDDRELKGLEKFSEVVPHAPNCWIKGCQFECTQVRLVKV